MPFASFRYVFLFLPVASAVYYFSAKYLSNRVAKTVLIVSSLIFYGSGGLINLPILIASIFFNYRIAKSIVSSADGRRRILLWIGILVDVALLATFKYTKFFL